MIQKFRKKPVEVEAIQWDGNSNKQDIEQFVGKELKSELESETAYVAGKGAPIFSLLIETKEGVMKAFRGDWIIKEPFPTGDRDFYPCKNDIFVTTYDVVGAVGGNRSTKTKEQIYRDAFECLTNGRIPDDIFNGYMNDTDGEGTSRLQWWCVDNMKGWCADWNTGIGIIEAVEHLYKVALENGNLSTEQ